MIQDSRFLHIGDLPSGSLPYVGGEFKEVFVRYISVQEMFTLHMGMQLKDVRHIIRGIQLCTSVDVTKLTDGDFYYIMAWLRLHSFPKAPVTTEWRCLNHVHKNILDNKDVIYPGRAVPKGYRLEPCGILNTQLIHNPELKVSTLDEDYIGLPYDDVDFPRVETMYEYLDMSSEDSNMEPFYSIARWVKDGKTLRDKIKILESSPMSMYERIVEVSKEYKHGIAEVLPLKCIVCGYKTKYELPASPFNFFADNTEQKILDMQYSLQQAFGMTPDNNMLGKQLLYFYSCLAKDINEQEERNRVKKYSKGKTNSGYDIMK